jgi:membrane protease YdiL (CAAX protease family)
LSPSLTVIAGTVLAATVLSLVVPVWWVHVSERVDSLPASGIANTHAILIQVFLLAAGVVLFVPASPAIEWAIPGLVDLGLILLVSPVLFALGAVLAVVWSLIGTAPSDTAVDEGIEARSILWRVSPAILVGPAEELLFRGLVQSLLVDVIGLIPGVGLMGILFGLYHYPNVTDSLFELTSKDTFELTQSGFGGVVMGLFYLFTGNLIVPIVGHSLHVAVIFGYFARQDDEPTA